MKTGEQISDDHGQTWTVDVPLGRGVWSRTWALRGSAGAVAVLKVPLRREDFSEAPDAAALEQAASEVYEALATLYWAEDDQRTNAAQPAAQAPPATPALAVRIGTVAGGQGFLFPRFASDLETRLQAGMSLGDVVGVLSELAGKLARSRVHGNLRPTNILLDPDRGLALTDPRPATAGRAWQMLERSLPARASYLPAEASGDAVLSTDAGWDTWALCQILHRATLASPSSDDPRRGPVVESPRGGLSRVALATLKDAAAARLKTEDANRRFASRATEKLGSLLGRGLSAEHDPSPPYRFRSASELQARLIEVADLIRPGVTSVSKPVLSQTARDGVFDAGQPIEFAVNISTTAGVTGQDDIATGVQLRDLDGPEHARVRVPNARFSVKQYPSGRWRFTFTLPDVPPGRYQLRAAFLVKGGDADALVSEGNFQVRPVAGYVPPAPTTAPIANAIQFGDRASATFGERGAGDRASPARPRAEDPVRAEPIEANGDVRDGEVILFPRRAGGPAPIRPNAYGDELDSLAPADASAGMDAPRPETFQVPVRNHGFDDAPEPPWRTPEPPTVASSSPPPYGGYRPPEPDPAYPRHETRHETAAEPPPPAFQAPQPSSPQAWARVPAAVAALPAAPALPPGDPTPQWSTWSRAPEPPGPAATSKPPLANAGPAAPAPAPPKPMPPPPLTSLPATAYDPAYDPMHPEGGQLDYAPPGGFPPGDLPVYDAPPSAPPPAWRELWARYVEFAGGDPLTAFAGVSASAFAMLVMIAFLAKQC